MSTTIDNKVVSMQFDNKHFEQNVQTSMSTLDKLKQKLRLDGASKGLQEVDAASKKVNMSHLGDSVEAVRVKFSAMQIMGVTALQNITNSAVNAGKRIVSALTIDPVKTGFQEYETQIGAVQTILANTSAKGSTLEQVNEALEQLNKYADQTIYNFTEMTRNIGTFTAAGVDLDTSVSAIKGIANLAAVSGSTSQQASTAMYQLSQALAAGKVSLMDWNSVVNAGMGGEVFQNALRRTSEVMGTGAEKAIKEYGSFRESLTKGEWLTTDVLTETLKQFTMAVVDAEEGTEEYKKQWNELKKSLTDKGYTEAQAEEILKMANTATQAATKVKTFTQLWDVLKESAQSGWSQSWKIIVGDFEEAKALLTPLADFFTGIIGKFSDFRNTILEIALGAQKSPFGKLIEKVTGDAKELSGIEEDYSDVVRRICNGDFKNSDTGRYENLTKAGYNWAYAQNKVNEHLGYSFRFSQDIVDEQWKLLGVQKYSVEELAAMSDEQLKALGYTQEQIDALRELANAAKDAGKSITEFINSGGEMKSGRDLLIESFKNIGNSLGTIFSSIGKAWKEIFMPGDAEELGAKLYKAIAAFNKFTKSLVISEDSAKKLKRTFKGLFAAIDIVITLIAAPIKFVFKTIVKLLKMFDVNILDVTANIGDAIVRLRDWIDEHNILINGFKAIFPYIQKAISAFRGWIDSLKNAEDLPKAIAEGIANGFGAALKFIASIPGKIISLFDSDKVSDSVIGGLARGIINGFKIVGRVFIELGKIMLDKICEVLGIHSPSREFFKIGGDIIMGLVTGIRDALGLVFDIIRTVGSKMIDWMKEVDFGTVISTILSVGGIRAINKFADAFAGFSGMIEGVGDMLEGLGEAFIGVGKYFKAAALEKRATALLKFALAIGVLVAAVFVLTKIKPGELWAAIGALAALSAILVALGAVIGKMGNTSLDYSKENGLSAKGGLMGIMGIATALLMMALTVKILGGMDSATLGKGMAFLLAFSALLMVFVLISKIPGGKSADKVAKMLSKLAMALLMLTITVKIMSMLDDDTIGRGIAVMTLLSAFMLAFMLIAKLPGGKSADKVAKMFSKIAIAMLLMVAVLKLSSMLTDSEIGRGISVIGSLSVFLIAFMAIAKLPGGQNAAKIGLMFIELSIALLIMVGVMALIGLMSPDTITKGLTAISILIVLVDSLLICAKGADKAKGTITAIAILVAVLAAVFVVMSYIDYNSALASSVALSVVVAALSGFVFAFSKLTGSASTIGKTIGMMSVIIALLLVLTGIIMILSNLDPLVALGSATAVGVLLTALMGAMFILSNTKMNVSSKEIGAIALLTGVIVALGLVLYLLSGLNPETALATTTSLSVLLLVMVGAMTLLTMSKAISATALGQAALALGVLLVVVAALAAVLYLLSDVNPTSAIGVATAITIFIAAFIGALAALVVIGQMASLAMSGGIRPLLAVIGVIALVIATASALALIPGLNEFLSGGIDLLVLLAGGIGSIIGAFYGGIVSGFAIASLAGLGASLSLFMESSQEFIEGAKKIDSSVLAGIGYLTGAILAVVGANFLSDIMTFLNFGENPLIEFGRDAKLLALAIVGFAGVISKGNIDVEAVKAAAETGKLLAEMCNTIPSEGGMVSWFTGDRSVAKFAIELVMLGEGIRLFSKKVKGIDVEAVTAAANAGKALAEMCDTIPNEGGVVGWFTGENSIAKFAEEIVELGKGLKKFSNKVRGLDCDSVEAAAEAGVSLAEMCDTIPNEGGVVGWFTGENSISKFAGEIVDLGEGLMAFSRKVNGLNVDAVQTGVDAALKLTEMADTVPNEGGVAAWFAGDNSLASFAPHIEKLGECLFNYSEKVKDIEPKAVSAATDAALAIVEMANEIPDAGGLEQLFTGEKSLASFASQFEDLGNGLSGYATALGEIDADSMNAATETVKALGQLASLNVQVGDLFKNTDFINNLPSLGSGLKEFAIKGNSTANVNLQAVTAAGQAIAEITKAAPTKGGMKGWVEGIHDMSSFENDAKVIGKGIEAFSKSVKGITNIPDVTTVSAAAKTLAEIMEIKLPPTSAANLESWSNAAPYATINKNIQGFTASTDSNDMTTFANNLQKIGEGMDKFATAIEGVDVTQTQAAATTISSISDSIKTLAGAYTTEGLSDNLGSFGTALGDFGSGIGNFVTNMGAHDFSSDNIDAAVGVVDKLIEGPFTKLADVADKDNYSGMVEILNGFMADATELGNGIREFYNACKDVVDSNANFDNVTKALTSIVNAVTTATQNEIKFDNMPSVEDLKTLGEAASEFCKKTRYIDEEKAKAAETVLLAIASISDSFSNVPTNTKNLEAFISGLADSGWLITDYFLSISSIEEGWITQNGKIIDSLVGFEDVDPDDLIKVGDALFKLKTTLTDISSVKADAADGFIGSLTKLSQVNLEEFVKAYSSINDDLTKAGQDAVQAFIDGVSGQSENLKTAGTAVMTNFSTGITESRTAATDATTTVTGAVSAVMNTLKTTFKSIGAAAARGFATGISNSSSFATSAVQTLATSVTSIMKQVLQINSPSKVFRDIGTSVPEGFAMGIGMLGGTVKSATEDMGNVAIKGINGSIAKIADIINTDIDSQPTIRPVLDLSNVESGVGALSGMFGSNPTIGIMSRLSAINGMMVENQNGANSDVISAIKDLGKMVNAGRGDTYSINGITYDDGSNVADAIKTLVRAAKIERRT